MTTKIVQKRTLTPMPPEGQPKELLAALEEAKKSYVGPSEEEGGVILNKGTEFKFIKLRNINSGKSIAVVLYEVDKQEFGEKVIGPELNQNGWSLYASFHTHPNGCPAFPSGTDLARLFMGFPKNYIYSPSLKQLNLFVYNKEKGWDAFSLQ